MKRKALMVLISVMCAVSLSGCQGAVKSMGGSMILELPAGVKLEEITWKDDSLWYLTRPMREGEEAGDATCRNHGSCKRCRGNRTYKNDKRKLALEQKI